MRNKRGIKERKNMLYLWKSLLWKTMSKMFHDEQKSIGEICKSELIS
jgi:hypothetical protein